MQYPALPPPLGSAFSCAHRLSQQIGARASHRARHSAVALVIPGQSSGKVGIERGKTAPITAVDDVEKQDAVAFTGPQDINIAYVLDAASNVLGRNPLCPEQWRWLGGWDRPRRRRARRGARCSQPRRTVAPHAPETGCAYKESPAVEIREAIGFQHRLSGDFKRVSGQNPPAPAPRYKKGPAPQRVHFNRTRGARLPTKVGRTIGQGPSMGNLGGGSRPLRASHAPKHRQSIAGATTYGPAKSRCLSRYQY
jgi:hypothetical protein